MRIVHITATAVGAPWLVELAREQRKRGHEVMLLIPSLDGTIAAALEGSGVVCLAASVDVLNGSGIFDRAIRLAKLVRLLRRLTPDVVHSHIINSVVTARLAAWLAGVPIRIGVNAGPLTLESELLRPIELGTAFCDTTSIASCGYTLELFDRYGIEPRELIFYAADERRFDPARADGARVRRELGVDDGAPLVGMVAYFYPLATNAAVFPPHMIGRGVKGHEVLLHAFARVVAEVPEAKLALVGRGWGAGGDAYERMLKELTRALGIEHAVLFTGERADVPDTLAAFDISVHPSLSDNLGGTLESLLMARPMVVSDIPGYRDTVVPEETGLVVPTGDAAALADAILRLLRDRDFARRLGENGRRRMLERFTLQRCADDYDALMARGAARAEDRYRLTTSIGRALALPWRLLPIVSEVRRVQRRHPAVRKPRIAQVAAAWANCDWFVRLCRDLTAHGYDVVAIIDTPRGDLGARLDAEGIRRHAVPMTFAARYDRLRLLAYMLNIPIAALRLARILRRERVDIVHSHIFNSVVIARIAAALVRAKHVAGIAGPRHLEAAMTRAIDRLTWWLDDVTVAGCRYARDLYASLGAGEPRLDLVYYGADELRFDPVRANPAAVRAALGIADEAPLVVLVANFYPPTRGPQTPPSAVGRGMKGHDDFLAAARIVARQKPAARFVVAGDGQVEKAEAYRARLIAECRNDDVLRDRVIFAGRVEDVPSLLAAADVAVQCSLTENLGGTIEALLMERPVVATRVGGMPESVRDGETGLLVPPSDPAALAAAILRLLDNRGEAEKLGRAGRRLMLERFTATRTADDLDRIYRRLGNDGAHAAEEAEANA
jgi:glycosyltransferase involved in cell wall biosynthesis